MEIKECTNMYNAIVELSDDTVRKLQRKSGGMNFRDFLSLILKRYANNEIGRKEKIKTYGDLLKLRAEIYIKMRENIEEGMMRIFNDPYCENNNVIYKKTKTDRRK